ncbi:MAG: glycosyltransferase family 4 protein [bacterium]|nr:glycosyltransferase family 4 protein [bacterium]
MGGAEHLAVQLANALASRGLESNLLVMGDEGPLSERIGNDVQVSYFRLARASIKSPVKFAGSLARGRMLLLEACRKSRLQIIQTHLPGANFWGLMLGSRGSRRIIATVHNNAEFRYGDRDSAFRAALRRWAYREILKRQAATVAVSEQVRTSLLRDLGLSERAAGDLEIITNGVRLAEPISKSAGTEVRRDLGVPEDAVLVVAAGRHDEQKNFRDLIEAARILETRDLPEWRLVIAGDGPLLADHRQAVQRRGLTGRVSLPGTVMNLSDILGSADIFALSSLWEGLPLVLLEAMSSRLAVVGNRIAGVGEVIVEGDSGLMADPGDPDSLAGCLSELISSRDLRQRLASSARKTVEERFDFERVVDQVVDLYRRC